MKDKYSISLLIPGMPFKGDSLDKHSLGGSETAGLSMARELRRLGHQITVFCNCGEPGLYSLEGDRVDKDEKRARNSMRFYPVEHWSSYTTVNPHDVAVVQRTPEPFNIRTVSRINLLWCHDIALGRQTQQMRGAMWNVDGVIVLSDWQRENYTKVYNIPERMLITSRNGIHLDKFPRSTVSRNRKRLVYSARPERGLDMMFDIFEAILERDPEFELALFGYDNPVEHLKGFYQALEERARSFGDRCRFVGRLGKRDLYHEYSKCGIYTYPTPSPKAQGFREISCISAMEAQASGMPIVTSRAGSLPETVGKGAGVLIDGNPWDDAYRAEFVEAVVTLGNDEEAYQAASQAALEASKQFDWAGVAGEWSEMIDGLFAARNDSRPRLARHFLRRSDVYAARAALEGDETEAAELIRSEIDRDYAFADTEESLRLHYVEGGKATDERLTKAGIDAYDFVDSKEKRYHELLAVLEKRTECQRILDFGCGHGWFDVWAEKRIGREWVGVDVDPKAVEWSRRFADAHAEHPENMRFLVGDHRVTIDEVGDPAFSFDCLIISEVLEHCSAPRNVVNAMERWVKPGGLVLITTPYGPSEYGTPNWRDFRNHLWEFQHADLEDLFSRKPKIGIGARFDRNNDVTGETCGYHIVDYEADHEPLGEIDMARKLRVQAPRQTLSVSMIAGPGAETLMRWPLASVRDVADEIVIADTGMNEVALRAASDYGARLVKGSDPKTAGFETSRNESLDACLSDWVLWIDTDEKLLDPPNLTKFLREGLFHGLSIRQHHFAVDAQWQPDMPVRCFRNRPLDGKPMRFFGMIHEHPETGVNEGPGEVLLLPDVHIAHVGYLNETARRKRFLRNNPLMIEDIKKYPDRHLQKHFILRDLGLLNMYDLQNNGGVITGEMIDRANRMKEIYREHFHAKKSFTNIDSLHYYTQALRLLNEGVEVTFSLGAERDGHGARANGLIEARYATVEEAEQDIAFRMRNVMAPLMPEHDW